MYMSICWYLRVLPVLHRPEMVDIGVKSYIGKHAICLKDYRIRPVLSIRHLDDRYSNLFLNAYINRHAHTEYLKMIFFYSPLGIWHVFLYSINTDIYHFRSMKYRQYA